MPLLSRLTPPRYDANVERRPDPRHIFDRDPLLIPQLFVDLTPPWYKRRRWQTLLVFAAGAVVTVGVLAAVQGPRGAMETIGRAGASTLHAYTRLVGSPDFSAPHH